MRFRVSSFVFALAAVAALLSYAAGPQQARAEDALRWKFNVGEKLDYSMVQDMTMVAAGVGPTGQLSTNMHQEMDMIWDVQGVNEQGEAVIKQKFERIKMKMTLPVGVVEYDSKSDAAPIGIAALIAPMYKAMTQGEFEITMTARGEIKNVKIPPEVIEALKASPGAKDIGEIATSEGFTKMISQGALVLPEAAPKKGTTWDSKIEINNPKAGKQTVITKYTYEGTKDVDGTTMAVIKPELKMEMGEPVADAEITMKIAEQSSDGELFFNIEKGRLSSTSLQQKVTFDTTARGQTFQQKIEQKIDVKVTPAGEKKTDDAKKSAAAQDKKDSKEK